MLSRIKISLLSFVFLLPLLAGAQPAGYAPVPNAAEFQKALSAHTGAIRTLQSAFIQTKVMQLLSDKVVSKGNFSYQQPDKVRLEYTDPFSYLMVMNAGQVMVRDGQKTSRMSTSSSKALQSANRIMLDCMRGTVLSNPDFRTTAYRGASGYLLAMKPATAAMQKMFQGIDVYLDKSYDVVKLVMKEQSGDYTELTFKNTRANVPVSDAAFRTR